MTLLDNSNGKISANSGTGVSLDSLTELGDPDNGSVGTVINKNGEMITNTGTAFGSQGVIGTFNNNNGLIKATGADSYAFANSGEVGLFTNNGGLITSAGDVAFAHSGKALTLDNSNGIISTTGNNGVGSFFVTGKFSDVIKNAGGLITALGSDIFAIYVNGDVENMVIEGGTISHTRNANNAVAIHVGAAQTDWIEFNNVDIISDGDTAVSGNGFGITTGIDVSIKLNEGTLVRGRISTGNDNFLTVNNSTIIGDISAGGNNTFVFNDSSLTGDLLGHDILDLTFQTDFTTGGTFLMEGDTGAMNITIESNSVVTVNHEMNLTDGDVTIEDGGTLFINDEDITTTGDFINKGTTKMDVDRTLSVGNIDDTADGTIIYIANNTANSLTAGLIDTGETAANFSNQTIHINYMGTTPLDTTKRALIGTGTGEAVATTNITDDSYIYDFSVVKGTGDTNTNLYLAAELNSVASVGQGGNNLNSAQVLLTNLTGNTNEIIQAIQANLIAVPDRRTYENIIESTQATTNQSSMVSSVTATSRMFDAIENQLVMADNGAQTGIAAGDQPQILHVWTQGFGAHANQGERGGIAGYDADIFGVTVGADTRQMNDETMVGVSFGYGRSNIDSNNANQTDTEVDTYQGTIYGNHYFNKDIFLTGMIGFGMNHTQENRYNVGGEVGLNANGEYDSWQAATRWQLNRNYRIDREFSPTLTPSLLVDYLHYNAESYTETGAGGANLQIGSRDADNLNLGIGLQAEWLFNNTDGTSLQPNLHISYKYDVLDSDRVDTLSSFTAGGGAFTNAGLDPSNSTLEAGAGLKFYSAANWDLTANYDYTYKSDYQANSGVLRATYNF